MSKFGDMGGPDDRPKENRTMDTRWLEDLVAFSILTTFAALAVAALLQLSGCTGMAMGAAADRQAAEMEAAK